MAEGELAECNIVMKGGITSGVVYPLAVIELAKTYRFAGIGGTSAGAIAAALTAAAELGRDRGGFGGGFEGLRRLAEELPSKLRSLFQPLPALAPLFELLMSLADAAKKEPPGSGGSGSSWSPVLRALLRGWVRASPLVAWCAAAPTLLLVGLGVWLHSWALGAVAAVLALLLGVISGLAYTVAVRLPRLLAEHDFGFCTGLSQPGYDGKGLVNWLADALDDLAGLGGKPLTFGDLDGGDAENPKIALQMFTTCLSTGRPHVMPWSSEEFLFRPDELRRIFPERIVAFMASDDHSEPFETDPEFRKLPPREHLPVIVAVRMSLSFPFLFCTVPLWARDFARRPECHPELPRRLRFSDGGICSNLPLQLFDYLWPKRPTFAVTLDEWSPEHHGREGEGQESVWMPESAGAGRLLPVKAIDSLGDFLGSLMNAMQNWQDRLQGALPGYRERIAHVVLTQDEGGLNLEMDPAVIERLMSYGTQVGHKLATEFDWQGHRWTRLISGLDRLADSIGTMDREMLHFFAERSPDDKPYPQTKSWHRGALATLAALRSLNVEALRLADKKAPKPRPQLRAMPRP